MHKRQYGRYLRILYGGSVSADNCGSFMKEGDIDGVLVGGSSLNVSEFEKLLGSAARAKVGYSP